MPRYDVSQRIIRAPKVEHLHDLSANVLFPEEAQAAKSATMNEPVGRVYLSKDHLKHVGIRSIRKQRRKIIANNFPCITWYL